MKGWVDRVMRLGGTGGFKGWGERGMRRGGLIGCIDRMY